MRFACAYVEHLRHLTSSFCSLPFFFLMVWMLSSAFARINGDTKKRFVEEEADEWRAVRAEQRWLRYTISCAADLTFSALCAIVNVHLSTD